MPARVPAARPAPLPDFGLQNANRATDAAASVSTRRRQDTPCVYPSPRVPATVLQRTARISKGRSPPQSLSSGQSFRKADAYRQNRTLGQRNQIMATLGTGAPKESTEWDDILKAKGIIPEKTPEELAEEQLKSIVEQTVETYDPHERKTVERLEEDLEDADSDEEKIIESYRQKRIQQMRAEAARPKFGPGVRYVSASDWKTEVSEAGADIYVIVHLFQSSLEACKLMDARLLELSAKFRHVKFVKCRATDAIKNYPDSKCPTLLVYKEGKVLKQFVGFGEFNSGTPVADDIEWALSRTGAVDTDLEEPPSASTKRFNLRRF